MSPLTTDLLTLAGAVAAAATLVWAVRARRRSYRAHLDESSDAEVCPHLRPAFDLLRSRGHRVVNIGQRHPDLPLEIHLTPRFDPKALSDELELTDPVFVSDRNVLYCKEDWCKLHPKGG